MTTLKNIPYKDFDIRLSISKDTLHFHCYASHMSSRNPKCPTAGYGSAYEAIEDIKEKIDNFLATMPKNYEELAEAIHDSLIWNSYEECEVDAKLLETLIENFTKNKK